MVSSICRFVLELVDPGADQPESGMNHKECEDACEEQIHEKANEVESRIQLAVARVGVGLLLNELEIGSGMATAACVHHVRRRHRSSPLPPPPPHAPSRALPPT